MRAFGAIFGSAVGLAAGAIGIIALGLSMYLLVLLCVLVPPLGALLVLVIALKLRRRSQPRTASNQSIPVSRDWEAEHRKAVALRLARAQRWAEANRLPDSLSD